MTLSDADRAEIARVVGRGMRARGLRIAMRLAWWEVLLETGNRRWWRPWFAGSTSALTTAGIGTGGAGVASRTRRSMPNAALMISLEAAVPLWIAEHRDKTPEWRAARARECAAVVAAHGDDIQFRGPHTADGFNRLAEGLALAAFQPGGVRFMDRRWQVEADEAGRVLGGKP
jgi:hypothetical protein